MNEEYTQQVLKDILNKIRNSSIVSYESFLSICQQAFDFRAPKTQKTITVLSNLNIPRHQDKSVDISHIEGPTTTLSVEQDKYYPIIILIMCIVF